MALSNVATVGTMSMDNIVHSTICGNTTNVTYTVINHIHSDGTLSNRKRRRRYSHDDISDAPLEKRRKIDSSYRRICRYQSDDSVEEQSESSSSHGPSLSSSSAVLDANSTSPFLIIRGNAHSHDRSIAQQRDIQRFALHFVTLRSTVFSESHDFCTFD